MFTLSVDQWISNFLRPSPLKKKKHCWRKDIEGKLEKANGHSWTFRGLCNTQTQNVRIQKELRNHGSLLPFSLVVKLIMEEWTPFIVSELFQWQSQVWYLGFPILVIHEAFQLPHLYICSLFAANGEIKTVSIRMNTAPPHESVVSFHSLSYEWSGQLQRATWRETPKQSYRVPHCSETTKEQETLRANQSVLTIGSPFLEDCYLSEY